MSSKISQKIVAVGLTLSTAIWLGGAVMLAPASAATTASLSAQIQALLAQVQQLQAQLTAQQGGSASASVQCTFTRALTAGSTGADVKCLQEYLNASGFTVAASGAGSVGNETTYFGPATKSAVAKWQAANGVTPSVGYFGPLSRAEYAKLIAASTTSTGGTGTSTSTTPTAAGLTVSLASSNPVSGNVAINAMNTPLMVLNFTAGSQAETVNSLTVTRQGFSQDTDLQTVYLYNGSTRLAQNTGINSGAITFSNTSGGLFTVPAGQTVAVTVSADITASTSSASHVIQLALASASNVGLAATDTVSGTFPVTGNSFTLVSLTNLATLTVTDLTTGNTTVNSGQTSYLAGQFSVQASNDPVKVTSVRLTNIGSIQAGYLNNIKLMNGSTQLGSTASLNNNVVTFDLSSNPLLLASGQSVTLSVYTDVTGGVGRTFQFSIQQAADVSAVDSMYNVGIGATLNGGSFPVDFYDVSVNNGGLVMSRDTNSPSTNVVAGNTNQVLAKFDVLASGDSIKFTAMSFTSGGTANLTNVRVTDQNGVQVGTTQTSVDAGASVNYAGLNYII
ncbi:MAG: peptidoglycan-binding protein, partial [Patescibacteria group bacterium]|nr:peptidoglycan-binding protein [Patescibacteria group bacterium]